MLRTVLAAIVGYLALALFVGVALMVAWMMVGAGFAFRPGTTDVTLGWLAINIPLSFIGAVLGGFVAALIDRSPRKTAVKVLALLVVALGLALALKTLRAGTPQPPKPISELSSLEAGAYAKQPTWYSFAIPFIGAAGILMGGHLQKRSVTEG